jgi:alpha-amylase
MKQINIFLASLFLTFNAFAANVAGDATCSPNPVTNLNSDINFYFEDGNNVFQNATHLYIHFWITDTGGTTIASSDWNDVKDEQEMSIVNGKYTVTINPVSYFTKYFQMNASQFSNAKTISVIVRTADGSLQTVGTPFTIGEAQVAADRFKFNYGIEGSTWSEVSFTKDATNSDKFTASVSLTQELLTAGNFYVAWNGGGLGEAAFGYLSLTTGLSTIPGIKTGDNLLVIYKSSTDENWGVIADGSSSQVPENYPGVMLQAFYWESQKVTSWSTLANMAGEIGERFDLVWLPPSAKGENYSGVGGNDVGYHPRLWSDQSSCWGSVDYLKSLIAALHNNGCKVIADIVVNHRAGYSNWCNFSQDNFGTHGTFQLTYNHICATDEVNANPSAGSCYGSAKGAADTGENWEGARDLDHTSATVQDAVKAYLKWLKSEIGYDGWRYDYGKGFAPEYIAAYNTASMPYFSVNEYWEGNLNILQLWLDKTLQTTAAFDFPCKYIALNDGLAWGNYANMGQSNNRPSGLINSNYYKRYAVTFVDNHDTYRDGNKYTGNVSQAYAYILSAPGTPCVFWLHWMSDKSAINAMIDARKRVGIHSQSVCTVTNKSGYYECETTGTKGSLICRIGSWANGTPEGYTLACNGNGWAYYVKVTVTGNNLKSLEEKTKVFPNPTENIVRFERTDIQQVWVTTPSGVTSPIRVKDGTVDLSDFPPAPYLLTLKTDKGLSTIKIIKK